MCEGWLQIVLPRLRRLCAGSGPDRKADNSWYIFSSLWELLLGYSDNEEFFRKDTI